MDICRKNIISPHAIWMIDPWMDRVDKMLAFVSDVTERLSLEHKQLNVCTPHILEEESVQVRIQKIQMSIIYFEISISLYLV